MTPAQELIVKAWARYRDEYEEGDTYYPTRDDDPYGPVDYITAKELGLPVQRVGEALVLAGQRPPVWWIG